MPRTPKWGKIRPRCPDCETGIGEPHEQGCDVERCTVCQIQRIQCGCNAHSGFQAAWSGWWPGEQEAASFGWFVVWVQGMGWHPCREEVKGAIPDLNSYAVYIGSGKKPSYTPEDLGDRNYMVSMLSKYGYNELSVYEIYGLPQVLDFMQEVCPGIHNSMIIRSKPSWKALMIWAGLTPKHLPHILYDLESYYRIYGKRETRRK